MGSPACWDCEASFHRDPGFNLSTLASRSSSIKRCLNTIMTLRQRWICSSFIFEFVLCLWQRKLAFLGMVPGGRHRVLWLGRDRIQRAHVYP